MKRRERRSGKKRLAYASDQLILDDIERAQRRDRFWRIIILGAAVIGFVAVVYFLLSLGDASTTTAPRGRP